MKQAYHTLAAMFAGYQRRSILQRGPAFRRQHRVRLGEHLPVDGDVLRHGKTGKWSVGSERSEVLRLFPSETAAEDASAAAQFYRHEVIISLCQARAGKTHQHPALLDPRRQTLANLGRQGADIREHDHRQFLVEKLRDRLLWRAAIAEPHIGERPQRTGEIERRCQ